MASSFVPIICTARMAAFFAPLMATQATGTPEGMLNAAQYVEAVQSRQGLYIACPEEIAWEQGFISDEEVAARGQELRMTEYGQYLLSLIK